MSVEQRPFLCHPITIMRPDQDEVDRIIAAQANVPLSIIRCVQECRLDAPTVIVPELIATGKDAVNQFKQEMMRADEVWIQRPFPKQTLRKSTESQQITFYKPSGRVIQGILETAKDTPIIIVCATIKDATISVSAHNTRYLTEEQEEDLIIEMHVADRVTVQKPSLRSR